MISQCFIMNANGTIASNTPSLDLKPLPPKEKVMSYEEKSVGSTPFFKCEACPYMALAEDDIKFHLFTVHPDLAKSNGLADNIQINCPGCSSVFDAEETLRNHLRNHHKMGLKDIRKMIKSLVQIALKNAKLKKESIKEDAPSKLPQQETANVKIPQLIEIVPDIATRNSGSLPKGVAYISVDELNKMSAPNFEQIDPKEVIQEASINIVYTNEVSTQYVNVTDTTKSNTSCNLIEVSSVPPDLISSIPRAATEESKSPQSIKDKDNTSHTQPQPSDGGSLSTYHHKYPDTDIKNIDLKKKATMTCSIGNCYFRFKEEKNLLYHRKCHQNGKLKCQECGQITLGVDALHTHLWKVHAIDMELPTCEICGFKTFRKYRLLNTHMKCHGVAKVYTCSVCTKSFKNANQLSKHRLVHKSTGNFRCHICQLEFINEARLKSHIAAVHDKVKPFKCSQCDYTAARKSQLKSHLRAHSGDKPYACDECSYRSSDHNAMRRHKKMHSKQSLYKCKYCPYTTIQSTIFTSHMISKHPTVNTDIHCCPYCSFKSLNKDKYVVHLTTHSDKEGIPLLIEMTKNVKASKPSWTIPSENSEKPNEDTTVSNDQSRETTTNAVNNIPIEVYDCDSLSESMPQDYLKSYCTTPTSTESQQSAFNDQVLVTDLSKDDNNSDCLISESSNDTLLDRHQYQPQLPLQMNYNTSETNLRFLNPSVSMEQNLLQNNNVNSLTSSHSSISGSITNNIMCNFPIRLPPAPQISVRNNIMLKAVDKISLPMTKVTGPIIKPTQILPVPSSIHSPLNMSIEPDGVPRKKAKISVKSNLVLKGPDQVNMFHSQQQMAFKRLEDNERYGLGSPVTFNNLITTQFMQLQPESTMTESPTDMSYTQESMLEDTATTPVDDGMNTNPQIFSFNQQMNINTMTMLPPPEKIQTNDPSYIKLEATIKQNTQSPSLEKMCNANLLSNQAISREYKASPPPEDIHKTMSEIKNEVKSDSFYNLALNSSAENPPIIDQYLIDNIIPEQYSAHLDLSAVVLPEISDQQSDVIEIDDNSDDNKLLPRFDMNFPLESLYLMHNDFHFLDTEPSANNMGVEVSVEEMNRMVTEVPIISQKESLDLVPQDGTSGEFPTYIQGKKDPMMNTSVRASTNKINVKNIELMKN